MVGGSGGSRSGQGIFLEGDTFLLRTQKCQAFVVSLGERRDVGKRTAREWGLGALDSRPLGVGGGGAGVDLQQGGTNASSGQMGFGRGTIGGATFCRNRGRKHSKRHL